MGLNVADLQDRLSVVRDRIAVAARTSGRSADDVTLVAVSKTFPIDVIAAAASCGIEDFGENRAQELKEKVAALGDSYRWHFIGYLQSNKVRQVVGAAELIHSVDRVGLGEAISRRALSMGTVQDVLIEVNVSGEPTKHGVDPAGMMHLADGLTTLEGLRVTGLMTMAPFSADPKASRPVFSELFALGSRLRAAHPGAKELSMGMTRDFEVAIEEGATIVRVGEAIFGPRLR